MSNKKQMESLAELSMAELEALENGSNFEDQGGQEDLEATESEQGEQGVDDATTGVQGEEEGGEQEPEGTYIETKKGKGKIPYAELQRTRHELAEMKRKLSELESAQDRTFAYQAELPEDYQAQVEAVDAEMEKLKADFESSELTWDEYQDGIKSNIRKREDLLALSLEAKISQRMTEQQAKEAWEREKNRFMGKAQDGIDYRADQERLDSLDLFIKVLAQDPSNEDKDFNWFLATAHAAVVAKHGKPAAQSTEQPPSGDTQQPAPSATPAKAPKAPFNSLSDIPSGTPPAKSEIEALGELSGAIIGKRFLSDVASIDKYLAAL